MYPNVVVITAVPQKPTDPGMDFAESVDYINKTAVENGSTWRASLRDSGSYKGYVQTPGEGKLDGEVVKYGGRVTWYRAGILYTVVAPPEIPQTEVEKIAASALWLQHEPIFRAVGLPGPVARVIAAGLLSYLASQPRLRVSLPAVSTDGKRSMSTDIDAQLEILESGIAEILPKGGLRAKLAKSIATGRPLNVKLGVDPTAPDLHLGHAVPLRKLRQFQDLGHQVTLIIGDFTAMIGDPSGRSKTRPHLSSEDVASNAETYTGQAFKILDKGKTKLVFNSKWLASLTMAEVLELLSRFTVAGLLVRDDFQKRYQNEQPIGLHEFLYPVMQAYDSVVLESDIEVGGSDQRFNLLAGRELQEKLGNEPQVCVMLPLLVGTDGDRKMSKSYGNHIGLTFEPWDMFGKVMSIPDELMVSYFRLATLLTEADIKKIEKGLTDGSLHPAAVKRKLGRAIVTIYYDADMAQKAEEEFDTRFKKVSSGQSVAGDVGTCLTIPADRFKDGKVWLPELVKLEGAASSNGEARRLISQGGVRLNGVKLLDPAADIAVKAGDILEVGKRPRVRVVLAADDKEFS